MGAQELRLPVGGLIFWMNAPPDEKTSMRLFSESITTTLPFGATTTPRGKISDPSLLA